MANNSIYPLTIIHDRYGGSYSGGTYVAFNLEAHKVSAEVFGDDCTAMRFWKHFKGVVGRGGCPDSAIKDLLKNLKK